MEDEVHLGDWTEETIRRDWANQMATFPNHSSLIFTEAWLSSLKRSIKEPDETVTVNYEALTLDFLAT
jgi:hypothetical protein